MPKVARVDASVPFSSTPPSTDDYPLASVALFSGVGLLISLVVVLMGVRLA